MKKTFSQVLAAEATPAAQPESAPPAKAKKGDGRMATTLRIEPDKLETLKVMAHRRGVRVNELVLLALDEFISRNGVVKS